MRAFAGALRNAFLLLFSAALSVPSLLQPPLDAPVNDETYENRGDHLKQRRPAQRIGEPVANAEGDVCDRPQNWQNEQIASVGDGLYEHPSQQEGAQDDLACLWFPVRPDRPENDACQDEKTINP